ncbi:MAG: hypothetical protein WCG45_00120 [bacterium]
MKIMKNLLFVLLNSNRISNEKLLEALAWFAVVTATIVIIWCFSYFLNWIARAEDEE